MKNSTKLKIWGVTQLIIGLSLLILGSTVFRDKSWDDFAWKPNFALFVPGMFIAFFAIGIIIAGFNPQITKFSAKLQSEVIDHAKEEIKESISKTADTIVPAITPSIKTAFSEINDCKKISKQNQLIEAKILLDNNLITEDEYQEMRKSILQIKN